MELDEPNYTELSEVIHCLERVNDKPPTVDKILALAREASRKAHQFEVPTQSETDKARMGAMCGGKMMHNLGIKPCFL